MWVRCDVPEKELFTKAVKFFCELLGISPNIYVYVDEVMPMNGACYKNDSEYHICLSVQPVGASLVTLAHELVHVKQFEKDYLEELYTNEIPYHERWWEQEAFAKESELANALLSKVLDGTF